LPAGPLPIDRHKRHVAAEDEPTVVEAVDVLATEDLERTGREVFRDENRGDRWRRGMPEPGERIADFLRPTVTDGDRTHDEFVVSDAKPHAIRQGLRLAQASLTERRFQFLRCVPVSHYSVNMPYSCLT
jgi:hypothetical protein